MKAVSLATALFGLWVGSAGGDVIRLSSGQEINGTFLGVENGMAQVRVDGKVTLVPLTNIASIQPAAASPSAAEPAPASQAPPVQARVSHPPASAGGGEIPAGTRAMVELSDDVDSSRHGEGYSFQAVLSADLRAGSTVLAPRGSTIDANTSQQVEQPEQRTVDRFRDQRHHRSRRHE